MKKRPIFFVLLLSFLFISCENLLSPKDSYNNGDGKTYTITGDINIEGALPNELFNENSANSVARTGFPTIPNFSDSDLNLSVSATNADSSSTIEGTINAEKTQFSINLPKGQWTITVSGEKSDVVILKGSVTVELNDEYVVSNSETIILKPVKTTDGKGNLSLKLALSIGSFNCGGVKATLSSSEETETKYILFTDSNGNPASEIDLEFSDISSGTYSFKLEFYERMIPNGTDDYECENIIYILNDTVNIFDGLTTNEWSGTGYSEDTFTLTQEMIASFAMTTFYVDAVSGNDDYEGTFFAPFKSIQSALDKIEVMNVSIRSSESAPYRILLKSDVSCENSSDLEASGSEKGFVMIEPGKKDESGSFIPLYLEMASYDSEAKIIDAKRDVNKTGRVIDIGVFANVTLKNLKITGGYTERSSGGGIYCTGNLTLDNCEIYGNESYLHGGGLSLITGIRVTGITCRLVNSKIYNNTSKNGNAGGVYIEGGNLIMEDGSSIIENTSNAGFGGGIYSSIYEHEGTVYNGTVTINGGEVSNNSAINGGGVYIESGDFTITGGEISENTSSFDGEGGGVYVSGGTFTIENDALISKNTSGNGGGVFAEGGSITINGGSISENIFSNDSSGGGGIYLTDTAKLTMTGGKISNNYPEDKDLLNNTFGGGVYVSGGTFKMEGGEISNNYGFNGGGVATAGSFSMSGGTISGNIVTNSSDGSKGNGSAVAVLTGGLFIVSENITINGDVYLFNNQTITTITVSDDFKGGEVMITPYKYESSDDVGVQVLKPIDGESLKTEIVRKFEVTPQVLSGEYEYWYVKSDGMLAKDSIIYVKSDASAGGDGTLDKPFITIQEAVNSAIEKNENGTTKYKILLQSDVEDTPTGSYDNEDNFSLININPSDEKQDLTLEIASYGQNRFTINANKSDENYGRVMYIGQKANVTLRNVNIKGGNLTDDNGGAIYCSGTLNLVNSTISNSKAKNGGGIYIENGTLTIGECAIIKDNATHIDDQNNYGGGIFVKNSNFIMEGGTIEENYAGDGGAGIYFESVSPTIKKGNIRNNKYGTEADAHKFGSEILLYDNAKLSISSSNVVIESLEGETRGIYVRNSTTQSELALSDSAYIKSPVYLDANANIEITGVLTTPEEANGIIATITPNEYTTRQVLVAGSGVTLSNNLVKQFNVTAEGGKEWFVDSYGYLGKVPEKETNDEGTAVYLMESYDNLLWIAQELKTRSITSFNMKLTDDIVIPSGKWQFSQLDVTNPSTIDGQGHSITINEDVSSFGNNAGGLFYKINNSTVKNLVLKGSITANTSGKGYIGALCRSAYKTTIQNVMSTVEIIDEGSGNAGGLVGYFGGNNGDGRTPAAFIKNCAVYADISSKDGTAGGLVGQSWENTQTWKIENCIYMGTVSSENGVAGALIGNENTGRTSYLTNIWYCESNGCAIFGKEGNKGNITQSGVESKTAEEIATEAAATLLNTNSDGTSTNWVYEDGNSYPTLKAVTTE